MFFDRETTIVITKFNKLTESVLTSYCQKFGKVIRCFVKTTSQSWNKEPYALIKFADASSVTSILSNRNHTINGTHVVMRTYHQDTTNSVSSQSSNLTPLGQQNRPSTNNGPNPMSYEQLKQENIRLKYEISNLQKSLTEAQIYSKTAYETFQALREKYEAEQVLTNKLRLEHTTMIESYETRIKQLTSTPTPTPTPTVKSIEKDKVKEEPMDIVNQQTNSSSHVLELKILKDHLEQTQIDLGKSQTENAMLNAKLISREQQFDKRYKELNIQYTRIKKQYEHVSSCIKDFHTKLYRKKRLQTDVKEEGTEKLNEKKSNSTNDSNDDVVEVIMQVEPTTSS